MSTENNAELPSSVKNEAAMLVRRRRFWSRVFLVAMLGTPPITMLALQLLTYIEAWRPELDVSGLIAMSVGILGILIVFIFLYKYQMITDFRGRGRWFALLTHALVVLALFFLCIWLAFDSPWSGVAIWGSYDLQTVVKPWIIAVLVIGTITLLGSLFDIIRGRMMDT